MNVLYKIARTWVKRLLGRGVFRSYGQFGEDAVIQAMLRERRGVYVDIGAYNPILYSNTYALYQRGWSGIAVDPNGDCLPLFRFFRPRDRFVRAGIGSEKSEREYYMFSDGAYNTFSLTEANERKRNKNITFLGSEIIAVVPLSSILASHRVRHIDLLNIDVEGMDTEVLKSHDWSIEPRVIAIEDSHFDPESPLKSATYQMLHEKGYILAACVVQTLIFRKKI